MPDPILPIDAAQHALSLAEAEERRCLEDAHRFEQELEKRAANIRPCSAAAPAWVQHTHGNTLSRDQRVRREALPAPECYQIGFGERSGGRTVPGACAGFGPGVVGSSRSGGVAVDALMDAGGAH